MPKGSALLVRVALSLILVGAFAIARPALAQSPTGTISGTIVDSSGAVLPGVIVTFTHNDSRTTRSVTTNEQGLFSAPLLPVGDYELVAEL